MLISQTTFEIFKIRDFFSSKCPPLGKKKFLKIIFISFALLTKDTKCSDPFNANQISQNNLQYIVCSKHLTKYLIQFSLENYQFSLQILSNLIVLHSVVCPKTITVQKPLPCSGLQPVVKKAKTLLVPTGFLQRSLRNNAPLDYGGRGIRNFVTKK